MRYLLILFALLVALPAYGQTQIPASKVTGIPAQLEEGGNQEMDVERLPTSCAENQIPKADATGGLVCAADEDSGAGSGGATDTVAGDVGGAATGADITLSGGTGLITTRAVDDIEFTVDGQQHVYLATTQAEAETARDACGVGVGGAGDTTNGCTVRLACGVIPWTTFTISGATTALGRDSFILEGCGAGGSVNAAGGEVGATVLQSSTAAAMIEVGICHGCEIRNLGFDGGDTATVAVDMTDASGGWPSSFFKIRNVDVDRINGFAFRTATVGQWDNLLIEGSSVRGSDGCYQQRDNQNKTMVWNNNECANLSAGATVAFDIQEGTFSHTTSFVGDDTTSLKYFDFGVSTQYEIRDSRFEMDGASQVWIEDGTSATASERLPRVVDGNFVKVEGTGAVCLDVARRGSFTFTNNALVDVNGAPDSNDGCTSDFEIDTAGAAAAGDTLQLTYFGNVQHNLEGAGMYPETWMPTVTGDVMLINPVSSHDTLEDRCTKGEVQVLVDGTSGQQVYVCETTATDGTGWVLQGGGASLPVLDTVSIAEDTADPTKEVRFDVGNNTTGVIGTIATAFTTAGTLFLPDVTADTAVARATTDTLTNKTIDYQTGASAPTYPRLAQSTTPPAGDCDAAAEVGRLYMDTDEDTDGAIMLCDTGPAWKAVGGGGAGFLDQTAGVLHPTTSTDDLANDATGTNWRMTNLGALTASSVTLDPADDAAMTLTTATDSADVSIGITGSTGPESIMDLNVDVGGAETKLMEIDGVAETVEMERPLELRNGTSSGELRIWEPSGSGTENVTFIVPPLALDTDYTLPTTDGGVDEFLQTNGAGVLTWAAPAGGGLGTELASGSNDITTSNAGDLLRLAGVGESLDFDFSTGTANEVGVSSATAVDVVDFGTINVEADQLVSDIVTGTAPLVVASTTVVTNLNADTVDGFAGHDGSLKANIDSPTFTTAASGPTPAVDDDDTSLATTEFVQDETPNAAGDISGTIGTGLTIDTDSVQAAELDLSIDHSWTGTGTTDFNGTVNVAALTVDDAEASASTTNRVYVLDDDNATGDSTCALAGTAGSLSILDADETATDDYQICDGTSILLDLNDVTSDTELAAWTGSANIVTVGTITSGVWTGTDILDADVADTLTIDASSTVDSIATTDLVDKSDTESIAGAWTKLTTDLTIDGVEVDYEAGGAEGYPRLGQSTTPPTAGCDAAAEVGRLYFDTDADTDGSVMVCKGAGPSWVEVDDDGGAGGFVSFDFTGNDGAPNSVITDGNTLTFTGGTNIDTTDGGAGVDTLTIDLDLTGITNTQALYDSSDQLGGMAQITHDGTNVTLDVVSGDTVEATLEVDEVYNNSGATIHKCAAVYISGFNVGADLPEITVADSDTAAEMPSLGLVQADISNAAAGFVVTSGMLTGVDTAVIENWTGQEGDPLYVAPDNTTTTDGNCDETLTETRPSGATDRVQSVARIIRVNATTGELLVQGAGRSNDVPNLLDGNLWVGNGSNVATSVTMGGDVLMDNTGSVTVNATHAGGTHAPVLDTVALVEDVVDGDKEFRIDVGSNAAGVAGTLTTAFTVTRVLALPDVTDTLASNNNVATMTNKNMDYQTGTSAPNYPRLAQSTTPPTGDCDAAAELGRLYFDTDSDTDGEVFVCAAGPAWKAVDDDGGAGGFTSFDVQGDDGAPNAVITNGNVLIVSGGNAITTEDGDAGADTLSIAVTANSIDHDELGTPLTMAATDVLNFDAWEDTDANGFILPTGTTSCANVATAGQACWRESDNTFWVGDGTAPPTQVGAGGSGFFDQTTGVLHPTTATDDIGNDATGTNWLITDAGDATVNTLAAADQESQAATTNEIVVFDDDVATGDSTCALAGATGELRIADTNDAAGDDWEICEGTTTLLDLTNIDGSGITNTAGVLSADLAVVAALASPTFTGTVTVPQPFTIGAISMTSTATELNLLDGVTDIATQGELDGFVGSSNIVTVGTITTGTWTGTDIAVADGGTGVGTFTSNGILIGDGGNALDVTAAMTNGQVLVGSTGADPVPEDIDGRSITPTTGAGTLVLDADEELYRDEEGFFILDGVLTAGEEVLVKANGALTLVQLDCVALGGSTPTVTYTVVECTNAGGTCVSSGLAASISALGTNTNDSTPTDAAIDDGDWWGLEATTLTTEPNTVNCTVEFTRND